MGQWTNLWDNPPKCGTLGNYEADGEDLCEFYATLRSAIYPHAGPKAAVLDWYGYSSGLASLHGSSMSHNIAIVR